MLRVSILCVILFLSPLLGLSEPEFDQEVSRYRAKATQVVDENDPKLKEQIPIIEWVFEKGLELNNNAVYLKNFGDDGISMVAKRPLKKGERLFSLPVFSTHVYRSSKYFSENSYKLQKYLTHHFDVPGSVIKDFELTEMGFIVAMEKKTKGSYFYEYFNSIQDPHCPFYYDEMELLAIQNLDTVSRKDAYVRTAIRNYRMVVAVTKQDNVTFDAFPTETEFVWAIHTVVQRSFDWGSDNRREYVMVPFMDMINHAPGIDNDYYYMDRLPEGTKSISTEDVHCLACGADHDYKPGETIFISYSKTSNSAVLFVQYGFVIPNNELDVITLNMDFSDENYVTEDGDSVPKVKILEQLNLLNHLPCHIGRDSVVGKECLTAVAVALRMKNKEKVPLVELFENELYLEALRFIKSNLEKWFRLLPTPLKFDLQLLEDKEYTGNMYHALTYRIEFKKLAELVIKGLGERIKEVEASEENNEKYEPGKPKFSGRANIFPLINLKLPL